MVTVTPKAIEAMKTIVDESKRGEPIRIFFAGYSCSGPAYMMGFDKATDKDVEIKADGFRIVYEKDLEGELKEAVVDAVETPQGPGVIVKVKSSSTACTSCPGCH
jgi:Fe-S cluster assembly iron-binding protein IscA